MSASALAYTKTDTVLAVDHVSLVLGGRVILRDVCAEIKDIVRPDCVQGQVVCFLGPSGIGKTQLSRVIAGLQAPTSGRVLLEGGRPVRKGLVGMVPQDYPLFEFLTVFKNLLLAGRQAGLAEPSARAKMAPLVAQFGLQPFSDLYPAQLSGGTRQRVAIARQLMCSEHFLVLDEPFSGLDPVMKRRASALITQVADLDELNTIILVTHDVTEGMAVADTVWLMGREPGQPGARLVDQIDLAAEGLCWRPDLAQEPAFLARVADVKARFEGLAGGV